MPVEQPVSGTVNLLTALRLCSGRNARLDSKFIGWRWQKPGRLSPNSCSLTPPYKPYKLLFFSNFFRLRFISIRPDIHLRMRRIYAKAGYMFPILNWLDKTVSGFSRFSKSILRITALKLSVCHALAGRAMQHQFQDASTAIKAASRFRKARRLASFD